MSPNAAVSPSVSATLAGFAATLDVDAMPEAVRVVARQSLLDVLGSALAGARVGEGWQALARHAEADGAGPARVWATGQRLRAEAAARLNAAHARALDYDDIIDFPQIHVSVCLVPAALALAEAARVPQPGRRLLAAIAAGCEIQSRLAAAIAPHYGAGLPTMLASQLFGYLSAAAACGRVLDLDAEHLLGALGLAQMQAAGTEEMVVHAAVSDGKVLYAALCNQGGLQSARMAAAGVLAQGDPVAGRAGVLRAFFPAGHDPAPLTAGLGEHWVSQRRCTKALPGTLVGHAFVEAALRLRERLQLAPEDIRGVALSVGPWGQAMSEPHAVRRSPPAAATAMNSVPFMVACALAHGALRPADFAEAGRNDPATLRMAARIVHSVDPTLARPGGVEPGIVTLQLADGSSHTEEVPTALGQPARPMSYEDVAAKFRRNATCAAPALSASAIDTVIDTVAHFEDVDDLEPFLQLLSA